MFKKSRWNLNTGEEGNGAHLVSFEASSIYGWTAVNKKQRNTACFTGSPGTNWKYASYLPSQS